MGQLTRRHFIQATTGALVASAIPRLAVAAPAGKSSIRLGVTLYSYTGDYARATVLQDCIADAAATGSEGIELLSKTHIPDYPNPSDEWIDRWGSLVRDHRMAPSCYDCCESELSATGSEHSLRHLIREPGACFETWLQDYSAGLGRTESRSSGVGGVSTTGSSLCGKV